MSSFIKRLFSTRARPAQSGRTLRMSNPDDDAFADNHSFAISIVVGIIFLLASDCVWLLYCIPRFYSSMQVHSGVLCRHIMGSALTKPDLSPATEALFYFEVPTVKAPVYRFLLFAINCSMPPVLLTYAVDGSCTVTTVATVTWETVHTIKS